MTTPLLRYQLAVSMDGFIGPHDGGVEWLEPYDEIAPEILEPFMEEIGGLLMGRLTYELMMSFGPNPFEGLPIVVLSSRTDLELGPGIEVSGEGPLAALEQLRGRVERGDIWLFGGGVTATQYLELDLVDRVEMTIVPVVLGEGKPLFPGLSSPRTLELLSARAAKQGTVISTYGRRDREP